MKHACVIGHPVAHSRSPLIHGYWLKQFGIDGSYTKQDVAPDQLDDFFRKMRNGEWQGCNITLPHKEKAFHFVDETDDTSRRIGSINTVWREDDKLKAMTTDGIGFCDNIEQSIKGFSFSNKRVIVVGAGGSSRAIVDEIITRKAAHVIVANRSIERAQEFEKLFGSKVSARALEKVNDGLGECDLLINTTSIGLAGEEHYPADLNLLSTNAIVTDIVYAPLETPLLKQAKARGLKTVTGLGMLLHQALPGFEKWFGKKPVVTQALYDFVAADLTRDQH